MSKSLVIDIMTIIKNSFNEKKSIPLHDLLWTIDAKHKLTPNQDELNMAIKLIGGCQKTINTKGVFLSALENKESDFLTEDDLAKAFKIYQNTFNNLK